ncbi:hypothetical protein [Pseudomonas sp. RGM 3321]|uniref:hypothetical protein n=1 Tax=Pseudomonas sp. RGM 3321 TaxID=2930089 RepID=UPI001FCB03D3|nr:hypothetical protein [Pseudomonas sp. RGM 3321]MCJ2375158.1 hypothetical protein [Pseudomonas sp. RGM 3321]
MSKSERFFIAASVVFIGGNVIQIFGYAPFMMAWGNQQIIEAVGGGMGLFISIQANQALLLLTWIVTLVLFVLGMRLEHRAVKP